MLLALGAENKQRLGARRRDPCYHQLLPKNPNCGCCASMTGGGPMRRRTIRRCRCGFASVFLNSATCACRDLGGGDNCANDSRTPALALSASLSAGGVAVAGVGAGVTLAAIASGAGVVVGRLVSKTMRSGHFRSE